MKWIRSNTVQNMFALWLGYLLFLIVMYMVHPGDPWNQMFHRPVFLIFAPLLFACGSLLVPGDVPVRTEVAPQQPKISRYQAWRGIVASVIVVGLVIPALVGLNQPTVMNDAGSKLPPNIALLVILALALVALWRSLKRLRTPG